MDKKKGFQIITYQFAIGCSQPECFEETRKIYNRVLAFYYDILIKEPELSEVPKLQRMRQLELLSVGSREESVETAKYPLPFVKLPLYFRRAAINDAIRLYLSYQSGKEHGAKTAQKIDASPTFYKGMYKEFRDNSLSMKLYDGEKWRWFTCSIDTRGRDFPDDEDIQSPTLGYSDGKAVLNVPVRREIEDLRSAAEWLAVDERICAVALPGRSFFSVLAVLDKDGKLTESHFYRGLDALNAKKKKLVMQMQSNRKSMGGDRSRLPADENKRIKQKLSNLSEDAVHKVTREIVNFCKERNIHIIAVPDYRYTLSLNRIGYIKATDYDWLGRRIISYLKYKAFGEGIIVVSVSNKDIAATCHVCKSKVKKYNEGHSPSYNYHGGQNFICPNGHRGNSYLNSAINVGFKFINSQQK